MNIKNGIKNLQFFFRSLENVTLSSHHVVSHSSWTVNI